MMFLLKKNFLFKNFSLAFKKKESLYNIMKFKDFNETDSQGLKEKDTEKVEDYLHQHAQQKYGQLIPFFLEKAFFSHSKHFVISMHLLPKAESLKIECLSPGGFYEKNVELKNLIPVCYEDYKAGTRRNLFLAPTFIDNEMIYFNTNQNEFYVFDKDSHWNEEGIEHSSLDLANRFNEKQWLDALKLV